MQDVTNHGSGRGLAVGAGDGDTLARVQQVSVDVGAVELWDFEFARRNDFRIVRGYGGGADNCVDGVARRVKNIFCLVPDEDSRAKIFEHVKRRRIFCVRAADLQPALD